MRILFVPLAFVAIVAPACSSSNDYNGDACKAVGGSCIMSRDPCRGGDAPNADQDCSDLSNPSPGGVALVCCLPLLDGGDSD